MAKREYRLEGRTAFVTGAAGGLGSGICRRLLDDGAEVVGLDIASPEETAQAVGEEDDRFHAVRCDVGDPDSTRRVCAEWGERLGGVDVLVNNAGLLSGRSDLLNATKEQMLSYFETNSVGALLMVQGCHSWLRASTFGGRIVNVASRTFHTGSPCQLAYVASKGALVGMTRVMARELGSDEITVNAVMPAQVATPGTRQHSSDEVFARTMSQQAIQKFVTPDDFAGLVSFLASDDGALMTGQTLVYDGGGLLH
ncbi:p-cumic alcohol dehydrogenase [Halopolyspora algeriensis]|uniref:p-cumic alcohol dehydrogenase n=1 Tax=Halopolyspora algeriensis TaxID=1500506 RepID=A0A368VMM2_9ACTN|nr:SDR family oxidoreductase [Halopolyspora algeriensis]RCW40963.1 p-cumic alcohol dehydrogenase [Halopolyspora algeriensis]TQM53953.1 p-cumic alcohol dehydrogenase [Halopolyspora algeriensis]